MGGLVVESRARACGVIEENSSAAKVACDGKLFRLLGLVLLRIDWVV